MSGPSQGSPVADSLWNENDQSSRFARSATRREVSSSWFLYGSPSARIRSGCEEADEALVVVPALDEGELGAARERVLQLLPVAGDREAGVVRGEDEADDGGDFRGHGSFGRVRDPRRPVLHPGEDGAAELPL